MVAIETFAKDMSAKKMPSRNREERRTEQCSLRKSMENVNACVIVLVLNQKYDV